MPRSPGFPTYVFIGRHSSSAAVPHPFPEHGVEAVREVLATVGFEISILGSGDPIRGEGIYFQDEPFGDEIPGQLADALTLRGTGAYAYALPEDSLDPGSGSIALFSCVGSIFPREGRRILLTHMWVGEVEGRRTVTTWFFGSLEDLGEANILPGSRFDTEPVHDLNGMAAIEARHEEIASGWTTPIKLMGETSVILDASGFEGPAFCFDQNAGWPAPLTGRLVLRTCRAQGPRIALARQRQTIISPLSAPEEDAIPWSSHPARRLTLRPRRASPTSPPRHPHRA